MGWNGATANRYEVSSWGDDSVLKLDCDDGYTKHTNNHRIAHFKQVNFMV